MTTKEFFEVEDKEEIKELVNNWAKVIDKEEKKKNSLTEKDLISAFPNIEYRKGRNNYRSVVVLIVINLIAFIVFNLL